jgi:hypothetical protein
MKDGIIRSFTRNVTISEEQVTLLETAARISSRRDANDVIADTGILIPKNGHL